MALSRKTRFFSNRFRENNSIGSMPEQDEPNYLFLEEKEHYSKFFRRKEFLLRRIEKQQKKIEHQVNIVAQRISRL